MTDYAMLIDGVLVAGARQHAVINPATERAIVDAPCASAVQINEVSRRRNGPRNGRPFPYRSVRRCLPEMADRFGASSAARLTASPLRL